jgi:hypothetical protein
MKPIIFISFTFLLLGCRNTRQGNFIPKEFLYPEDSIGEGKTFVFYDSLHNRYTYADVTWIYSNNKKMKSLLRYSYNFKLDSVLEFEGRIFEMYYQLSVYSPKMYKADHFRYTIFNNKSKIGKLKSSVIFRSDTMSMKMFSKTAFLKDTSILWNGSYVPCLVTRTEGKFKDASGKYHTIKGTQKTTLYNYYAKGIGRIKYTLISTYNKQQYQNSTWELISIDKLNKEKASNQNSN